MENNIQIMITKVIIKITAKNVKIHIEDLIKWMDEAYIMSSIS